MFFPELTIILYFEDAMPEKPARPDLSIVIPAYNTEKTLLRSLTGLLNQNMLNCEIIIVNDGSTDGTRDIVLDLIINKGVQNIKLIDQENRGLGGARNTGIKNATSDYITFLDADDTLDLNVVKEATSKAQKDNYDIVMFRFERIGQQVSYTKNLRMLDSIGIKGISSFFFESTPGSAWGRIYNTNFLINTNLTFPEKRFHEDLPFVSMAYYYAKSVSYVNKIGYNWICTEGSITSSINRHHIDGMIESLTDIKDFLIMENIYDYVLSKFVIFCFKHINGLFFKIDKLSEPDKKKHLLRYLKHRIYGLDINNYKNFIWKHTLTHNYIKNINRVFDL